MSEGAGSSSDAAVRLSLKRSSDIFSTLSLKQRDFILVTPCAMLLCFWMIRTSGTRLGGVGKFVVGGTFVVDVNDWDCESRDNLRACGSDVTTVVCSSGVAKELMSNESRLLDFLAAARNSEGNLQRKNHREVCTSTQMWCSGGGWASRRVRPSSGPSCQDGGERLS